MCLSGCCGTFVWTVFFYVANGVLLVLACALIAMDYGYLSYNPDNTIFQALDTLESLSDTVAVPIILVCVLLIFVIVDGIIGYLCNNVFMLILYAIKMGIIGGVCLAVSITLISFTNKVSASTEENMNQLFNDLSKIKGGGKGDENILNTVDQVQTDLKCCGANGTKDYEKMPVYKNGTLPPSCCKKAPCNAKNTWSIGCIEANLKRLDYSLGPVCLLTAIIIIILAILAACNGCKKCPLAAARSATGRS